VEAAQAGDRLRERALRGEPGECPLERRAPLEERVDRDQVVGEGRLRGRVLEAELAQPGSVRLRPRLAWPRVEKLAAKQELREPVAGADQVTAQVLAAANEVAEALLLDARHPAERELAGGEQAGEADRVTAVGLHPIVRLARDQTGSDDAEVEPAFGRGTGEREPGRTRFPDRRRPRAEAGEEVDDRERRAPDSLRPQLAGRGLEHGRVCVSVAPTSRPTIAIVVCTLGTSHDRGSRPRPVLRTRVNPHTLMRGCRPVLLNAAGPLHRV
jgi:hypothetical protein